MLSLALHLPKHKVLTSFEEYGNTNGASPLITLCHRLPQNTQAIHIFNASMGAGLAWGFTDMNLAPNVIHPVTKTDLVFDDLFFKKIKAEQATTS